MPNYIKYKLNYTDTNNIDIGYTITVDTLDTGGSNIKQISPPDYNGYIFSAGNYDISKNSFSVYFYKGGIAWYNLFNDTSIIYRQYASLLIDTFKTDPDTKITIGNKLSITPVDMTMNPIIFPTPPKNYLSDLNKLEQDVNEVEMKKKTMEEVLKIQNRWNMFNDTYKKRYIEYIKIICIVVFAIICIWLCILIDRQNILPEGFLNFIITCILSVAIITIYLIYQSMLQHNVMKFDEIDYKSPVLENDSNGSTPGPTTPAPTKHIPKCTTCPTKYTYNVDSGYCELSNSINLVSSKDKISF